MAKTICQLNVKHMTSNKLSIRFFATVHNCFIVKKTQKHYENKASTIPTFQVARFY